jgi:flagellar basal-body rod modification protein FlgD
MNLNDSMEKLAESNAEGAERDLMTYVGKQVTGEVDTMQVSSGQVSGGFFNLSQSSEVMIEVMDSTGKSVKTINMGTKGAGSHLISWDGTDNNGDAVDDGTYTYSVLGNSGAGYLKLDNSITGTVEGVAYVNEKGYLNVQGILINPESLSSVNNVENEQTTVESPMSYLGKTVTSNTPIIEVDEGVVKGTDLTFELEKPSAANVSIFDASGNLVRVIKVDAEDTEGGSNSVSWDALGTDGYQVGDGLYSYRVETLSGYAKTPVREEVSGIRNTNGSQYLVLADSGRMVSIASITAVDN